MLGTHRIMSLAASSKNHVMARSMSIVLQKQRFYFQTDQGFQKFSQMQENPQVALSYDNIQMEGQCRLLGSPTDAECIEFLEAYRCSFPSSFQRYSHLKNEIVCEVLPSKITLWKHDPSTGEPYREFFDFERQHYEKCWDRADRVRF